MAITLGGPEGWLPERNGCCCCNAFSAWLGLCLSLAGPAACVCKALCKVAAIVQSGCHRAMWLSRRLCKPLTQAGRLLLLDLLHTACTDQTRLLLKTPWCTQLCTAVTAQLPDLPRPRMAQLHWPTASCPKRTRLHCPPSSSSPEALPGCSPHPRPGLGSLWARGAQFSQSSQ
jgi:hypothetical protein